jgi:hypothetical protein
MRTLEERCLYLHCFTLLTKARAISGEFIERLGHRTPAVARAAARAA